MSGRQWRPAILPVIVIKNNNHLGHTKLFYLFGLKTGREVAATWWYGMGVTPFIRRVPVCHYLFFLFAGNHGVIIHDVEHSKH